MHSKSSRRYDQCWYYVRNINGRKLTNDVGSTTFWSSAQHNCQWLGRCRSNALGPTNNVYALPTNNYLKQYVKLTLAQHVH